jgi:hypothetical protein
MNWLAVADRQCAATRGYPGRFHNEVVLREVISRHNSTSTMAMASNLCTISCVDRTKHLYMHWKEYGWMVDVC